MKVWEIILICYVALILLTFWAGVRFAEFKERRRRRK